MVYDLTSLIDAEASALFVPQSPFYRDQVQSKVFIIVILLILVSGNEGVCSWGLYVPCCAG